MRGLAFRKRLSFLKLKGEIFIDSKILIIKRIYGSRSK